MLTRWYEQASRLPQWLPVPLSHLPLGAQQIEAGHLLRLTLEEFRRTPEEIVRKMKYGESKESAQQLKALQATVDNNEEIRRMADVLERTKVPCSMDHQRLHEDTHTPHCHSPPPTLVTSLSSHSSRLSLASYSAAT